MISFIKACQIANKTMKENGYADGFLSIKENESKWIFIGSVSKDGPAPFGSVPFSVEKQTGKCEVFILSNLKNIKEYSESDMTEIPEEYKFKAS